MLAGQVGDGFCRGSRVKLKLVLGVAASPSTNLNGRDSPRQWSNVQFPCPSTPYTSSKHPTQGVDVPAFVKAHV